MKIKKRRNTFKTFVPITSKNSASGAALGAGRAVYVDTLQRSPHPLENRFLLPLLVQKGVQAGRCEDALKMLKGTLPQDIRLQVSTWISFPQEIFPAQDAPPVSLKPVANSPPVSTTLAK